MKYKYINNDSCAQSICDNDYISCANKRVSLLDSHRVKGGFFAWVLVNCDVGNKMESCVDERVRAPPRGGRSSD